MGVVYKTLVRPMLEHNAQRLFETIILKLGSTSGGSTYRGWQSAGLKTSSVGDMLDELQ